MEALPKMSMIKPEFRTSALTFDNIPNFDFRTRVKEYILMHFQADPHAYDGAFDDLSAMKMEANRPVASVEGTCMLKRYYGQLCMMQKRFPMSAGQELETPFTWFDGMAENRHLSTDITFTDIEFEKASVMFNIGAAHAQIAEAEDRESQDSIKNAFMHFQYAAYAFGKLREDRFDDQFYPSIDLDPQVLAFFQKVMLAQAQECLVQKSLLDNRTPIVIAKLSKWLQDTYEECAKLVDEWNVNISEKAQKALIRQCILKMEIYATITYLSMGDHAEKEEKKMGTRLAYYKLATKHLMNMAKERGLEEKVPEMIQTMSFLSDVVQAKTLNAEKENNFIYHDKVPKEEELIEEFQKDGAMCKTKPLAFNPLDRSVCGDDIFGTLLPPTVLQSVSIYEEKKAAYKREIIQDVYQADQELQIFLEKVGYSDLKWMINEGKDMEKLFSLPDMLLERNAEMTSQPDAIPVLLEKLRESADTSRVLEAKLNTLISKLKAIDLPRLKNDAGYIMILNELTKLSDHLVNAKANNVSLNKAIAAHSTNLQILSLPIHEMRQKLTPSMPKTTNSSKEETALKRVMDKIEEMKRQREKLLKQLEDELMSDDISKELLAERDFSHDHIFEKEMQKHAEVAKLIRMNIKAQDNILHAFAEANADFCDERLQLNTYSEQFNNQVMILVTAYDIFKDVVQKMTDAEKFNKQLSSRCDQFAIPIHAMEEQFRAEVEQRERVKREHDERVRSMKMQREAREAMSEFGGPAGGSVGSLGSVGGSAHPTLRDYMGQYRSRRNQQGPAGPVGPVADEMGGGGPPSPTPSSICDFSMSERGGSAAAPPAYQQYQQDSARSTPSNQMINQNYPAAPPPPQPYQPYHQQRGMAPASPAIQQHVPANPMGYQQQQPQNPMGSERHPMGQSAGYQQHQQQNLMGSVVQQHHQQPQNLMGSARSTPVSQQLQNPMGSGGHPAGQAAGYQQHHHQNPMGSERSTPVSQQLQNVPSTPTGVGGGSAYGYQQHQHQQNPAGPPSGYYRQPQNQGHQQQQQQHHVPANPSGQSAYPANPIAQPPALPPVIQQVQSPLNPIGGFQPQQHQVGYPSGYQQPQNQLNPLGQSSGYQQPPGSQAPGIQQQQQQLPYQQNPNGSSPGNVQQQNPVNPQGGQASAIHQPSYPSNPIPSNPFQQYPQQPSGYQNQPNPLRQSGSSHGIQQHQQYPANPIIHQQQQPQNQLNPTGQAGSSPGILQASQQQHQQPQYQLNPPDPQGSSPVIQQQQQNPIIPPPGQQSAFQQPQHQNLIIPPGQASAFQQSQNQQHHQNPVMPTGGSSSLQQQNPVMPTGGSSVFQQQNQQPSSQGSSPGIQQHQQKPVMPSGGSSGFQQQQPKAPSPWHVAPANLGMMTSQWAPQNPQNPQGSSNVDLLSDLLGDFNLPPPMQPSKQEDFRQTHQHREPDKRPAAAVLPMPQQQKHQQQVTETPILSINTPSSVSYMKELVDPKKFELGEGDEKKLEKRMLHHSIRTNGPPPPMNQMDPLNQIDAFGFLKK